MVKLLLSTQINVSKIEALSAFWKNWKGINETRFTRLRIKFNLYLFFWFMFLVGMYMSKRLQSLWVDSGCTVQHGAAYNLPVQILYSGPAWRTIMGIRSYRPMVLGWLTPMGMVFSWVHDQIRTEGKGMCSLADNEGTGRATYILVPLCHDERRLWGYSAAAESWFPSEMGRAVGNVTRFLLLYFGIFVHRFVHIIKDKTVLKISALENLNTAFVFL